MLLLLSRTQLVGLVCIRCEETPCFDHLSGPFVKKVAAAFAALRQDTRWDSIGP